MIRSRIKQSLLAGIMTAATVAGTSFFIAAPAGAVVDPDTGAGSAFGIQAQLAGGNLLGPTPTVSSNSGQTLQSTDVSIPLGSLVTANALVASTSATNFGTPDESVSASAGTAGTPSNPATISVVGVDLLNALDIKALTTTCTSTADGSIASTSIIDINGTAFSPSVGEGLPANPLLSIRANVQTRLDRPSIDGTSVQVIGLQVTVLATAVVVNIAESNCAATGGDIEAPPVVTAVSPSSGLPVGGTHVTISGRNFRPTSTVLFGTTPATNVTFVNTSTMTATSPPGTGTVDVRVTNTFGESAANPPADQFTYQAPTPIISATGVSPLFGPTAGGTLVTILGSNFNSPANVTFGGSTVTGNVVSANEITAVTPPHAAGAVSVTVTNVGGGSATAAQQFTFVPIPIINPAPTGINPTSGPTTGGTLVTITGSGFDTNPGDPTTVVFDTTPGTAVTVVNSTTITVVSPPHVVASVPVTLADDGGVATAAQLFTYTNQTVTVSGINPAFGPTTGGTSVTITGTGFGTGSTVTFGGLPGTVTTITSTQIVVTDPAHAAGPVDTIVTTPGVGTSQPVVQDVFTYVGTPVINADGISPLSGPTSGGTTVTITGSGFAPGDPTSVDFGTGPSDTNLATNVDVVSTTEITAVSPPHAAGPVFVAVIDTGGSAIATQQFTYVPAPTIIGISPTSGPQSGGETVIIGGTNLCGSTAVTFGPNNAPIQSISADCTTIKVTEPAGTGTVPVVVTTPVGPVTSPINFTYISPGYWEAASDGGVFSFGGAQFYGSTGNIRLNQPIVAMADTPDHGGYWLFAADGGVFSFGDAPFLGSVPGVLVPQHRVLNGPIVAAEASPSGNGYRLFATDGGVFDFGDALFVGSLPGIHVVPEQPITAAVSAPIGQGYWLSAADGGIFSFGAANNEGSGAGQFLGHVSAMACTPDGLGYWEFLASGPVAHFGDAPANLGGAQSPSAPIVFGQSTSTGDGYWEFGSDGAVYSFGDAPNFGSLESLRLNAPITAAIAFGSNPIT
ncbi:MAG TPA: IPT/TIG domain-containing protein [Acidimicrobiales bacterium]|jgi:hypothetical protein